MRFSGGGDGFGAGGRPTTMAALWGPVGPAGSDSAVDGAVDRQLDQIGDQAMAAPPVGRQLEYAVDLERLGDVEDDPGHPGTRPPETEPLDQTDRLGGIVAKRPVDLRQVDRQPGRLAERDMVVVDLIAEVDHHAGDVAVTGDPDVLDSRIRGQRVARSQHGEGSDDGNCDTD